MVGHTRKTEAPERLRLQRQHPVKHYWRWLVTHSRRERSPHSDPPHPRLGVVWLIAEDPGEWPREPVRVNANELAGWLRCGPAGPACRSSRCGKTAVEAMALVRPRQAARPG